MVQNRYRLRGTSLAELGARAVREYGPSARVVASERVSAKGLAGFFGGSVYEATVEVPEVPALEPPRPSATGSAESRLVSSAPSAASPGVGDTAARAGVVPPGSHTGRVRLPAPRTTVGDEGDSVMIRHAAPATPAMPSAPSAPVSPRHAAPEGKDPAEQGAEGEEDPDFSRLMEGLWKALREGDGEAAGAARTRAPAPLREAGALVVITGVSGCAEAAHQVTDLEECVVWQLEQHQGATLRDARRSLLHARAEAVARGVPVVAIAPVTFPRPGIRSGADHPVIGEADQLWATVDVRRKSEDTRRWLTSVAEHRMINGAVLVGTDETLTPDTGRRLGLPVLSTERDAP